MEIENLNLLRQLGAPSLALIPQMFEGRSIKDFTSEQIKFMKSNFHVVQVEYKLGQMLLHFKSKNERAKDKVSILKLVAEKSEIQKGTVRKVYEALVEVVHEQLKINRKAKLPELATINLRFKPARKAGKMANKFKPGTFFMVKARKASNKLRINPVKPLRTFAEKLPVVAMKVKKSKKAA